MIFIKFFEQDKNIFCCFQNFDVFRGSEMGYNTIASHEYDTNFSIWINIDMINELTP